MSMLYHSSGAKALRSKALSSAAMACLALLILISGSSLVQAQATATKPKAKAAAKKDAGAVGQSIKIGQTFPSLKLKDQDGKAFDLAQTLKKGPVALVIFRSADW